MSRRILVVALFSVAAWIASIGLIGDKRVAPSTPPEHAPALLHVEQVAAASLDAHKPSVTPATLRTPTSAYGYCPEDGASIARDTRPPLSSLLSLNASELMDQVRQTYRKGAGSPKLRQALTSFFASPTPDAVRELAASPDRVQDGFDYAAAAAIVLGTQAMSSRESDELERMAKLATGLAPSHPSAQVLAALAARQSGNTEAERQALQRAHESDPDEPAVALALGEALAHTMNLKGAIAALTAYLEQHSEDTTAGQLRERVQLQEQLQRDMKEFTSNGITLLYPPDILSRTAASAIHRNLLHALHDAALLTDMQRRQELTAVVYRDRADLIASTCVPNWTDGVFDGTLRLHAKSVQDESRSNRVVRHEVFHAQLRSLPLDAPHWFHEGGAQYFADELGPSHLRSFRFILKHRAHIPMESMDGSFLVIDGGEDARLAYHQSLAMMQMLVARHGARALALAVTYLRNGGSANQLWTHMMEGHGTSEDLFAHLRTTVSHPR